MATINQLVRKPRKDKRKVSNVAAYRPVLNVVAYVRVFIQQPLKSQTLLCVKLRVYV